MDGSGRETIEWIREQADREETRRLRKRLLEALYEFRISASGWTDGAELRDILDASVPDDGRGRDEHHALGLARDLVILGMAEERRLTRKRRQKFSIAFLEFRLTAAGLLLHLMASVPHPLICDGRVVD